MKRMTSVADCRAEVSRWANAPDSPVLKTALVPTMGALHDGHAALIRTAHALADVVVVSIFVNPLQFGLQEDFSRYPRSPEADDALCQALGVDVLFVPTVSALYPDGMENTTQVTPPARLTERFCGACRPGHFTGVATIVLRLLTLIRPNLAVFGEKDAQQLAIIRKMARDFHLPVDIISCPTVRTPDGLALSSRNTHLKTDTEKQAALSLIRILRAIARQAKQAGYQASAATIMERVAREEIEATGGLFRLQYLAAVNRESFEPVETLTQGTKLLIAGYVNEVRLIDNLDIA